MEFTEIFIPELPPLRRDETGTIRVGGTRVTLETVVEAWQDGATVEEIAEAYDSLTLAQVYAVVSYYLNHLTETQDYLERRRLIAEKSRTKIEKRFPPQELRTRLLARQSLQRSV